MSAKSRPGWLAEPRPYGDICQDPNLPAPAKTTDCDPAPFIQYRRWRMGSEGLKGPQFASSLRALFWICGESPASRAARQHRRTSVDVSDGRRIDRVGQWVMVLLRFPQQGAIDAC